MSDSLGALNPSQWIVLGHVMIAMLLGGALGMERELASKPAGLRTHMLVTGAATLLVLLSDVVVKDFDAGMVANMIRVDPLRIVEAVITGVSFLGAGTIIVRRGTADAVEGLTTAASILFAAGIGIAVALGQLIVATGATALTLITLRVIGSFASHHAGDR